MPELTHEMRVTQIVGVCRCHEAYTTRLMIDPMCAWHEYHDELIDGFRTIEQATWEEAADYMHTAHLHQTFGDCEAEFRRRAASRTP